MNLDRAGLDRIVQAASGMMIVEGDHPLAGKIKVVGVPVKLSDTPGSVRKPAPLLGEHTAEVLRTYLRMSATEIAARRQAGVIGKKKTLAPTQA